jgi:hypothetical protein
MAGKDDSSTKRKGVKTTVRAQDEREKIFSLLKVAVMGPV